MSAGVLAMLLGLFAVPTFLLWAGHHWRTRSSTMKGAFWGGVVGHTLASILACIAAMYLPEHWSDANPIRGAVGYWSMLVVGVAGIALGALTADRKRG